VRPEIALESRIQRDVALIVAEQVELNFIRAAARQVEVIERVSVRRNQIGVGDTVRILPDRRFWGEEGTKRVPVRSEESIQ